MPEVSIEVHGVSVHVGDHYGDLEEIAALALGLASQAEQQWRENQVSFYSSQMPAVAISPDGEPDNNEPTR